MPCNLPSVPENLVQSGVQMKTQRDRDKGNRENEERDHTVCLPVCSSVFLTVSFGCNDLHITNAPSNVIFFLSATSKSLPFSVYLVCNHSISPFLFLSIIFWPVVK